MAYLIPGVVVLLGALLMQRASTMPQYTDPTWDRQLPGYIPNETGRETDKRADQWYKARAKALTLRDRYHDIGLSLALMGATIAVVFGLGRVWRMRDLSRVSSPSRLWFFLLAAATWISFAIATGIDEEMQYRRGDFPQWAEPVPLGGLAFLFAVVTLVPILLGVLVAAWGTPLPVKLWSGKLLRNPVVELLILGCVALDLLVFYVAFTDEPCVAAPATMTMYLLLSGRAAASHPQWSQWPWRRRETRGFEVVLPGGGKSV
jgi:hypothetical protein